jgi:hypothetical protein
LAHADGGGEVFADSAEELGFGVEEVDLGGCAGLEEIDDAFGFRGEMRVLSAEC